jgi:hypothetical protein
MENQEVGRKGRNADSEAGREGIRGFRRVGYNVEVLVQSRQRQTRSGQKPRWQPP